MPRKKTTPPEPTTEIVAFKGFDTNLQCRGYQFEVGKTYEHSGKVEVCGSGFHACENPMDVWGYYGPTDARFAVVKLSGEVSRQFDGDSKIAAGRITIEAELTMPEFIRRAVQWVIDATKGKGDDPSGDDAQIGSSGYYAQIGSSGYGAQIGSSGYYAQIDITGQKGVVAVAGRNTWVKAKSEAWVSLASYDANGDCDGFATGCIGRDGLKLDTWYRAEGGKLVETA